MGIRLRWSWLRASDPPPREKISPASSFLDQYEDELALAQARRKYSLVRSQFVRYLRLTQDALSFAVPDYQEAVLHFNNAVVFYQDLLSFPRAGGEGGFRDEILELGEVLEPFLKQSALENALVGDDEVQTLEFLNELKHRPLLEGLEEVELQTVAAIRTQNTH